MIPLLAAPVFNQAFNCEMLQKDVFGAFLNFSPVFLCSPSN